MTRLLLAVALLLASALPAFAKGSEDRASVGSDITIAEGETAGDVACVFCSVHVHGDVRVEGPLGQEQPEFERHIEPGKTVLIQLCPTQVVDTQRQSLIRPMIFSMRTCPLLVLSRAQRGRSPH